MTITSALVLFSVIWFMTFLCVIPIHLKTQGDMGEIVPGTQAGAPEHHNLKKKAWITTAIAFVLWVIISGIIISGWVTISDIDLYHRMAS
jgi:predicted secreted protein